MLLDEVAGSVDDSGSACHSHAADAAGAAYDMCLAALFHHCCTIQQAAASGHSVQAGIYIYIYIYIYTAQVSKAEGRPWLLQAHCFSTARL